MMLRLIHYMRFPSALHTQYLLSRAMPSPLQMLHSIEYEVFLDCRVGLQGSSLSTSVDSFRLKMLSGLWVV